MHNQYDIQLQTGSLQISVSQARYPLSELLTFGARQNPKRRYLFISKVLGKYVPCKPSQMRQSYRALVEQLEPESLEDTWVLGVAETATGLGAGVAQELARARHSEVLYSHTTRCSLACEVAFSIVEAHSHAPSHLIYALDSHAQREAIQSVIVVDDEISTGRTVSQLTEQLTNYLPNLKRVVWSSLVNWLSAPQREAYCAQHAGIELVFNSLLDGGYQFTDDPNCAPSLPEHTASGISKVGNRPDTGRIGHQLSANTAATFETPEGEPFSCATLDPQLCYTVIGTGEFIYQPFLFAESLERRGIDVLFQSTGRSPIYEGVGISRKESFYDEAQQASYYLYNQPYDRSAILLYESREHYENCPLRQQLGAQCAILA